MTRLAAVLVCVLTSLVATSASATAGPAPLASQGVVKWRFQVSGQYVLHPPGRRPRRRSRRRELDRRGRTH